MRHPPGGIGCSATLAAFSHKQGIGNLQVPEGRDESGVRFKQVEE